MQLPETTYHRSLALTPRNSDDQMWLVRELDKTIGYDTRIVNFYRAITADESRSTLWETKPLCSIGPDRSDELRLENPVDI